MRTASSKATTTRIGNSRQNDRFLRPRRVAGLRPPEAVLPSDTASAALSSSAAGPLASALLPVSALLLASALLPVSALLLASALLPVSALRLAWAVLLVSARAWSGTLASGVLAAGLWLGPRRHATASAAHPRPFRDPGPSSGFTVIVSSLAPNPGRRIASPRHRGEEDKPGNCQARSHFRTLRANAGGACAAGARASRGPPPRPPPGRRPARPGRPRARRHPRRPRAALPAGRSSGWAGRAVATAAR